MFLEHMSFIDYLQIHEKKSFSRKVTCEMVKLSAVCKTNDFQ